MSRTGQYRVRAAAVVGVSSALQSIKALTAEPRRRFSIESLESRVLLSATDPYGSGSHYFDQFPFSSAASAQSTEVVQSNPNATGTVDAAISDASVRYADGQPELQVTDLSSGGFGRMWGVTRSWSPDMTGAGSLGNHWYLNQLPQLVQESTADANRPAGATATVIEVSSGTDQRWFDYSSGTGWVERYGGQDTLVDTTDPVDSKPAFLLTDTTGTQTYFFDFTSTNGSQKGQFRRSYDPYGNVTQVTSTDAGGEITEVRRSNGANIESWLYTYGTLGGSSVITDIMLRRSSDSGANYYTVAQAGYSYYGSGATNGNVDDLESVQIREGGPGTLGGSLTTGTGLTVGQAYYYQLTAVTSLGETSVSPEFTITPTSGNQQVALSWSAYPGATTYNLYRGTTSGGEQQIATGLTTASYTDAGGQTPGSAPPLDVVDTDFYTYWLSGQYVTEGGTSVLQPQGALKYVFSSESFARMSAALPGGTAPASATSTELAPYADSYLVYDSSGRVYQATIAGQGGGSSGQGTFTYAYSSSGNSAAFNHWSTKTAETLPDSTTETVYSNYAGEPMLEGYSSGGKQWGTFDEYNTSGQVTLEASPSALNLPSSLSTLESNADLLHSVSGSYQYLSNDSGQITLIDYYSSTTATSSTAGAVSGYYEDTKIEQGQAATGILQETRTYFSRTSSGSVTIYPVAADTVYRTTSGGGETTSYAYSFYSGTDRPQTETITLPTITGSENGPNTTDSQVYTFDQYERVTQFQDGDGYDTTTAYDMGTGGITQTVVDSGGLSLATNYVVNGNGQDTEITDPNSNVTYIIYLALSHATLTYPGWHEIGTSGNYATTGPVQVEDTYYPAANASSGQQTLYYESLTIDPPVEADSTPEGNETIDAADIHSLTRSLTNAAGQVYETDAYSSLAGLTYSTATPQLSGASAGSNTSAGNYSATLAGYDSRGREDHTVDPNGTITDVTFDGLSRTTSISQGTNDTTSNNMVDVQDNYYDQRQSAPSAPTLGQSAGGSLAAATYYVTVTYVGGSSESLGSTETSCSVSANNLLTITAPAARTGATGYNVFVATATGQETQQNTSPISIGTGWTEPTGGLVAGSLPPVDQVGDSNLTQVTTHPGLGAADQVTDSLYNWRDQLIATKQGVQTTESTTVHRPINFYTLDNLGEVTGAYQYDADGMTLGDFSSGQPTADAGKLRAETLTSYDEQQRPYLYQTYEVNLSSGAVSSTNILSTNLYYNNRDNVIAESDPGGQFTKYSFDGADRVVMKSITDGGVLNGATQNWSTASTTSSDVVVEQTKSLYSGIDLVETIDRQRFDNDATTSSGGGDLGGPSASNPNLHSRDYYTDYYYDAAHRLIDTANIGTNGGSGWSEPTSPESPSDSYLLTTYGYAGDAVQTVTISGSPTGGTFTLTFNGQTTGAIAYNAPANGTSSVQSALAALSNIGGGNVAVTGGNGGPYTVRFMGSLAGSIEPTLTATSSLTGGTSPSVSAVTSVVGGDAGRVQTITDPKGLQTVTDYDLLGRTQTSIAGFSTGVPSNSADQTTAYSYDANGDVLTMTAMQPSGGTTPNQTTGYVYSVGGTAGTNLFSNDLLATTEFPDPTTGSPSTSSSNEQNLGYNFQGQETSMTDRNGTAHDYSYDVLARLAMDSVQVATGNPQNVDTSVQSLGFSYNTLGLPYQQTSYSGQSGGGSVINQVTDSYNGFAQLTGQTQNLGGGISGTVDYVFSETNNGTENNSRPQATVYPSGRVVDDNYSSQQSPITSITHSGTTATVTTSSADGLSVGQTITVSGASPSAYDGTFTVASIISSTQFTYTMSSTPASNGFGSYMMVAAQGLDNVISRADGLQDHSTGTVLEADTILGVSTVVQESHPQTGIDLTYITQSGDPNPPPSYAATGGDRYGGLDQFGRVVDQYYLNPSTPSSPTDDFQYAFDRDGNPLYKNIVNQGTTAAGFSQLYHSNGASEANAYDPLGREINFAQGALSASGTNGSVLDTVSTATTAQSWSLDALGNWSSFTTNGTAQTRSYNGQNQLTAVSGATTPTYDHNGNMTKDQNGTTYKFDAWNRMVFANTGTANETFGYLAGGQRASIAVSGSAATYSFFNAAWQELELANNTGPSGSAAVQDTYVWGLGNINEVIARDDASGNRIYVQQDANWDVTALIGKVSGVWQPVERFSYSPYGVVTVLTGTWGSTTDSYSWLYRYQAGKYDSLSGLYNFRNRDYSPTLGQWIEADPAGYVQGANLYEANLGAPISHVDPYGTTSGTGSAGNGNNSSLYGLLWNSWEWWKGTMLQSGATFFYSTTRQPTSTYVPPSDDDATGDDILYEYFNSVGPTSRNFGQNSFMTKVLQQAPAVVGARQTAQAWVNLGKTGTFNFNQPHTAASDDIPKMIGNRFDKNTGATGFIGGYVGTVTITQIPGTGANPVYQVHFHAYNSTNVQSGSAGPASRPVDQTWNWDEYMAPANPNNVPPANAPQPGLIYPVKTKNPA